jgi:MFS family permease
MLQVLRHAPRPVWVLIVGTFVNRVGSYFSTFVVLFLTERGFGVGSLPLVLAAIGMASMAGSLAGGWLADRVGRKRTLVGSMAASSLALCMLALMSGQIAVVAAVCVVALCTQSYVPAASALLVDHTAPADRVPLFALFRVSLNLGAALGPLIAGVIAAASYDVLFVIDSATCLLFAVLLLAGLPGDRRGQRAPADAKSRPTQQPAPRPARGWPAPVVLLCLATVGVTMIYAQHSSTLPLQLTANGLTTQFYGLLLAFNGLLVVAAELPLAALTRRYEPTRPMLAGVLLISGGMALCGLLSGAIAVLAAVAVWSLGEMVLTPVALSAVAALSSPDRVARDQGLIAAAQTLGFCLGPVIGVVVYAADPLLPWLGCLAVGAASALAIAVARTVSSRASARTGAGVGPALAAEMSTT